MVVVVTSEVVAIQLPQVLLSLLSAPALMAAADDVPTNWALIMVLLSQPEGRINVPVKVGLGIKVPSSALA